MYACHAANAYGADSKKIEVSGDDDDDDDDSENYDDDNDNADDSDHNEDDIRTRAQVCGR